MRVVTSLLVMLALTLAGCSGDGEDDPGGGTMTTSEDTMTDTTTGDTTTTGETTSEETSEELAKRDPVTWDIEVADNEFVGGSITIQVGDTVRWTHNGSNPHTVSADDGAFDSHPDCTGVPVDVVNCMQGGDTFEHTFEEVGEVSYACKVHSSMTGTITVMERSDETP